MGYPRVQQQNYTFTTKSQLLDSQQLKLFWIYIFNYKSNPVLSPIITAADIIDTFKCILLSIHLNSNVYAFGLADVNLVYKDIMAKKTAVQRQQFSYERRHVTLNSLR